MAAVRNHKERTPTRLFIPATFYPGAIKITQAPAFPSWAFVTLVVDAFGEPHRVTKS
jgi:hypothetical protein